MSKGLAFFLLALAVAVAASNIFLDSKLRPLREQAMTMRQNGDIKASLLVQEVMVSKYPYHVLSWASLMTPSTPAMAGSLKRFWGNLWQHRKLHLGMLAALALSLMIGSKCRVGHGATAAPFAAAVYVSGTILPYAGRSLYPLGIIPLPLLATTLAVGFTLWFSAKSMMRNRQRRAFSEVKTHIADGTTTWSPLVRQRHHEATLAMVEDIEKQLDGTVKESSGEAARLKSRLGEISSRLREQVREAAEDHKKRLRDARESIQQLQGKIRDLNGDLESIEIEKKNKLISRGDYKAQKNEIKQNEASSVHARDRLKETLGALENPPKRVLAMATQRAVVGQVLVNDLQEHFGGTFESEASRPNLDVALMVKDLLRLHRDLKKTEDDLRKSEAISKELSPSRRKRYEELGKHAKELRAKAKEAAQRRDDRLEEIAKAHEKNARLLQSAESAAAFNADLVKCASAECLSGLAMARLKKLRAFCAEVKQLQRDIASAREQLRSTLNSEQDTAKEAGQ